MTLRRFRVPRADHDGIAVGLALHGRTITIGDATGVVGLVTYDGPEHLAITLDTQETSMTADQPETYAVTPGMVLSVITGRLLCDLDDLYGVLSFLTGRQVASHQVPAAVAAVEGYLREEFPDLAETTVPQFADAVSPEDARTRARQWLASLATEIGWDTWRIERPANVDTSHFDDMILNSLARNRR